MKPLLIITLAVVATVLTVTAAHNATKRPKDWEPSNNEEDQSDNYFV